MIELKGVNVENKGAHLMLLSILNEFQQRGVDKSFCIEPGFGMNYFQAAENKLYLRENFKGKKLPWSKLLGFIPQKKLENYGLVLNQQVNVILDGSGFAYGDFWGSKKVESRLENFLKKKTAPNCKLILLPQAMGSFEDKSMKKSFLKVVESADLIFARDSITHKYLIDAYGDRSNIKLAPDFTNLLNAGNEENYKEGDVCIIPNYKMFSATTNNENYYIFLEKCIQYLQGVGKKPYFLIHEGEKDKNIAFEINKRLESKLLIVEPDDPIEIKNRIKSSELIIVSRFHGLVSALSQGIPAITTSWSHKYREILKDYNSLDCLVDITNLKQEKVNNQIKRLLKIPKKDFYERQRVFINKEKNKSIKMWDEIFKLI